MSETTMIDMKVDVWPADHWLSFHGNHLESVGILMGPGWPAKIGLPGKMSTVTTAVFDPDHEWPDGRKGMTRLGLVKEAVALKSFVQVKQQDGKIIRMAKIDAVT